MVARPGRRSLLLHVALAVFALIMLGVVAAGVPLSPAWAKPPAARRVSFWHSMAGDKGRLLQKIIDDYNAKEGAEAGIIVEPQFVGGYPEGINKLRTSFMGGLAPHLVQIYEIGTQVMLDSRTIVPLADMMAGDPDFTAASLLPQVRRYYEVGGRLYGLPFATSNPVLFYNRKILADAGFAAPPRTFAEMRAMARALTRPAEKFYGATWPLVAWFFEQFVARQGQVIADHDNGRAARATTVQYATPEGIAFVELWRDLVRDGSFANVGRGWAPALQNFLGGRSAMLIYSSSDVFEIAKKVTFDLGTAPIFPAREGQPPGGTIVGGNALWIIRGKPAAEQAAAYAFVKHMASKAVQRVWHAGTGYFPIRGDVIDELTAEGFYDRFPAAKVTIDQLRAAAEVPATQGALLGVFPEAREHLEFAIEQVLAGQAEPLEALQYAEKRSRKALDRYNKLFGAIGGGH